MRSAIRLAALAIAIVGLALLFKPAHGPAMTIGNGTSITIEGQNLCGGPPTDGNFLQYSGGQWCDATVPTPTPPTYPNTILNAYISTLNTLAANTIVQLVNPTVAGHIVGIQAIQLIASAGCTTQAQICALNASSCVASSTLTLNTTGNHASPTLSAAFTPAQQVGVMVQTADSGCSTHAQAVNVALLIATP